MYTMESKDEMYLLTFSFIQHPFVICDYFITCDLFYATKRILVAKCLLQLKFSCKKLVKKYMFFF